MSGRPILCVISVHRGGAAFVQPFLNKRFYRFSSVRGGRLTRAKRREELYPTRHQALASPGSAGLRRPSGPSVPMAHNVGQQVPAVPRQGGFLGSVMDGLAHGVGWAFGMRAVDALFGPRQMDVVHQHTDTDPSSVGERSADAGSSLPGTTTDQLSSSDGALQDGMLPHPQDQWTWGHESENDGGGGSWDNFDIDL